MLGCALMRPAPPLARARARERCARASLAGRGVELDPPVEAAHRLPHDREPEAEALRVAVPAAVEAVEDLPLRVRAHADAGVLDLDAHRRAYRICAQYDPPARRVFRGVLAEVAQRLLEQVAVHARREILRTFDLHRDAVVRPQVVRDLAQQRREGDLLGPWPLLHGVRARERQERASEARQPVRLALDVREEAVALCRVVLRARLQHLDRADDRRQRRAQLVRGVRDELALGELAPLLLGEVVEHDQHRVALGLRGDADERERAVVVGAYVRLRGRAVGVEQPLDELAQREALPRLR